MKAHVLYLCALSSAVIFSADTRAFLYSNSFTDNPQLVETNQTFESESQVTLFLESPALKNSYKTAGVYFITNNKGQVFSKPGEGSTFDDPSGKQCMAEGYELTSCDGTASDYCPYNDKYFKTCCDSSYKYDKSVACPLPQTFSEKSCGGKYRCECRTEDYPFTTCEAPKEAGEQCTDDKGTRYATCSCPTGVDVAKEDCKTFYKAPCGDVCEKAYEDTCHRYEGKGVPFPFGCEDYFDENCESICKKAYKDECHKFPDALDSCPAGATCSHYEHCSSKIQSFTCPSGFDKSDKACLFPMPVVYGDKTVTREFLPDKTPIAVVFDEKNFNAIGLVEIKTDGKPVAQPQAWSSADGVMTWSDTADCDIPELENCDFALDSREERTNPENYIQCAPDGKENTEIILAKTTCKGTYYAAEACYKFEPTGCSNDFCRAKEWFLPSPYEWAVLYSNWSKMQTTLKLLKSYGAMELQWTNPQNGGIIRRYYHTSSEKGLDSWGTHMTSNKALMENTLFRMMGTSVASKGYDSQSYSPTAGYRTRPAIKYSDYNCLKYTAVVDACPKDAICTYFDDCPSKVKSFTCYEGYEKIANMCLDAMLILYSDGTTSKELDPNKKPIGLVFDEDNHLAVALTDVKEDGSAGSEMLAWSNNKYNIPGLVDCDFETATDCAIDGYYNTDDILAYSDNCGGTPAATASNLYQPADCTATFCKAGNWFLPSMRDLNNIYQYRNLINKTLTSLGKDKLTNDMYWSSTEKDEGLAWVLDMRGAETVFDKDDVYHVRPVIKYK